MQPDHPVHLAGELTAERFYLSLKVDGGGYWELTRTRKANQFVGQRVEVIGRPAGFNGLICDEIWLAGQPRPTRRNLSRRHLAAAILFAGALGLMIWNT